MGCSWAFALSIDAFWPFVYLPMSLPLKIPELTELFAAG
jgi:hypothetical protein